MRALNLRDIWLKNEFRGLNLAKDLLDILLKVKSDFKTGKNTESGLPPAPHMPRELSVPIAWAAVHSAMLGYRHLRERERTYRLYRLSATRWVLPTQLFPLWAYANARKRIAKLYRWESAKLGLSPFDCCSLFRQDVNKISLSTCTRLTPYRGAVIFR